MRVGFFGQTGPYAPPALRILLKEQRAFEIVLVVEGRKTPPGRSPHRFRSGKRREILPDGEDLAELSVASGLPTYQTSEVNSAQAIRLLAEYELDFIVCVGFDRLFMPEVLQTARRGGINAHPSRLPELRGPSPIFWALKRGQRDLAVTLHALDAQEDHGPIYAQETFLLPRRGSGEAIYGIAGELAARMLVALLERAATSELHGLPQDHSRATRAPRPKPEDALVDPAMFAAETLVDFCCGAPFFRAPWMRLGEEMFFVRHGLHVELGKKLPGHYMVQRDRLIVQCKDGLAHLAIQAGLDDDP